MKLWLLVKVSHENGDVVHISYCINTSYFEFKSIVLLRNSCAVKLVLEDILPSNT